jgi:hypothetical protein
MVDCNVGTRTIRDMVVESDSTNAYNFFDQAIDHETLF